MVHTENLVVGLGIAGINLCHQLEKAGRPFRVIDHCPTISASLIAGGIYNPVVPKRKVKSWKVDELFPLLVQTYTEMEQVLDDRFLMHDFPILKPISSVHELNEWKQAVQRGSLAPYVLSVQEERPPGPFRESVIGSVTIVGGGYVRMEKLVLGYRAHLKKRGLLIEHRFDRNALQLADTVRYNEITAERIFFCEGRFIQENPLFNWLPFRPTKGQMLTVRVPEHLTPDHIYNQQFLLFPTQEENVFRLGATYEWDALNETPTGQATNELLARVQKTFDMELEVLDAQAAVRPNVADRRPVLGRHPEERNVYVFNGMGSKGVMLAPFFARQLVQHVLANGMLTPEVDLMRFGKRWQVREKG